MPYLKLTTNVEVNKTHTQQLLTRLSKLMAQETGKPESYVMVAAEHNSDMLFAGNNQPLAYLEGKSIGLSSGQAKALSAAISELLKDELQINPNRVYIEFSNAPGNFWGWNGSTF